MKKSRMTICMMVVLAVFIFMSISVMAVTVEIEFSGYIDSITSNPGNVLGDLVLGQAFSGLLSYSDVPDQNPGSNNYGNYSQDASISVDLGTKTVSYIDDYVYINVYNGTSDEFDFAVDGGEVDFNFTYFGISLIDSTASVYDDASLPMEFDISDFDSRRFKIYGYALPNWDWFEVDGEITHIAVVPEPGTVLLFCLGGLIFRRRKRTF